MTDAYGAATDQPDPTVQEDPERLTNYWLNNLQFCERKYKRFWKRGDDIVKRYKNKRSYMSSSIPLTQKRMNVLWANVQTQMPVLFSQTPRANCTRRNDDESPVGRVAAMVLEGCLNNSMQMQPFDYTIGQNVQDLLLCGHSISITEYVPEVADDQVGWQEARTRYIHWKDWVTNIARNWEEVWFWAYKSYLTRAEVRDLLMRTGSDEERTAQITRDVVLDHREDKSDDDSNAKATVWTVWDKSTRRVLMIATGYPREPLSVMDPPVNFQGFFPVPRPLQATTASDSTIPIPDFDQYQDQADEIDMLTQRINRLIKSLRMRGVYAADMDSLKQLAENSSDQDMIPVDNWQLLMEKGGIESALAWFPLEQIATTLIQCYEARDKTLESMYQITGISDIMRGATEASETATAQQLKSQYGGIRVRDRQRDIQRYIRDIIRLQSEIIAEHFEQPVLQAMSGVQIFTQQQKAALQQYMQVKQQYEQMAAQAQQAGMPPPPPPGILQATPPPTEDMMEALNEPTWEEVLALLRNEKLRGFIVDVETDSTIEADQMLEQKKATEFITAVTQFMAAALPMVQAAPVTADLVGEMLEYGARQFRAGVSMETTINQTVERIKAMTNAPQPPNPQVEVAKIKADAEKGKAQADMAMTQMDLQVSQVEHQQDMQKLAFEAANPRPQPEFSGAAG